jgi:hypothetical protein
MAAINFPNGSVVYLDANMFVYAAEVPNAFPKSHVASESVG